MSALAIFGVLSSTLFSGASLLYATLGETINQRAGIVNLGIEGVLLISGATAIAVTSLTGNPYLGMLAAVLVGGLTNLILAFLVVTRRGNQLASGLALMFFGFGVSALIGRSFVGLKINGLPRLALPGLANLPPRYLSLFQFDILIYLAIPTAVFVWWVLFRTRWGLGVRAVGENADTAFAAGRNPHLVKYQALFAGGMLAGLGAAHLTIAYVLNWSEFMTGGRGFIAIALVIFSKWNPIRAVAGALLFSGAVAFQLLLQASGVNVSPFLLDTLPYLLTILVLIVWGGSRKIAAPASLGRVYMGTE